MKLKFRTLSLLLAVILLFCPLLSSCRSTGEEIDELDEPVVLCDASNAYYTLVTPENTLNSVLDCMERIKAYPATEGASLVLAGESDQASDGAGRLEILIGKTNRAETKAIMNDLAFGDWAVVLEGDKIVVAGHTEADLRAATKMLCDKLLKVETDASGNQRLLYTANCYYRSENDPFFGEKNPLSAYKIVHNVETKAAAERLQAGLKEAFGIDLPIVSTAEGESKYEIVVGDIGRDICDNIKGSNLDEISYLLQAEDGKLLIGTKKSAKLLDAVDAFCDTYLHTFYSDTLNFAEEHRSVEVAYSFHDRVEMAPGSDIRVMSFNVLCELWDSKAADYHHRAPTAVAVVKKYAPHVVGLQEMSDNYHSKIKALFGEDYTIIDPKNERGETNFSPLAYNTKKVTLKEHGTQIFSEGNNTKLRLAAWALFEDKESGKRFVVVNTHWDLGGNPAFRTTHAKEMGDVVNQLKGRYNCAVITTGDYNTREDETQYRLFVEKNGNARGKTDR